MLSPQLLAEARSDTARKWTVRALCVGADPELFFRPGDSPATEARHICTLLPRQRPVPGVRCGGRRAVRHLGRPRPTRAAEPAPADPTTGSICGIRYGKRRVTPEQRRLRARIAANARWSHPTARADQATAARAAIFTRLERQVDPTGLLTPEERAALVRSAGRRLGAELNAARARKRRSVT